MRTTVLVLLASGLLLGQTQKATLLNVQNGEMPSDASAKVALVAEHGRNADDIMLKVTYAGGGAFGQYQPKKKDWTGYRYMKFYAFNPQKEPLALYLAVRDREQPSDWANRADIPFSLAAGPNDIVLDLSQLKRNQSPKKFDPSLITQWFIAGPEKGEIVYFGDIRLESDGTPEVKKPEESKAAEGAKIRLEGDIHGKKLILEGKVRLELDVVSVDDKSDEKKTSEAPQPGKTSAPAAAPTEGKPAAVPLIDLNTGELSNDHNSQVSLSDEYSKELGGKTMKVVFKKGQMFGFGYWSAATAPRGNWDGYHKFCLDAFNPGKDIAPCYLAIRDKNPGYENRADMNFVLAPGLNKISLDIATIFNNAGKQLDKKNVTHWFIVCDQDATLYFANIRLEKE